MSSLRSSSALSYNVFGPWRDSDLQPLGVALHAAVRSRSLRFEQKFPHGLRSTPPNLDVVIDREMAEPLGIECKFTEPYGAKKEHAPLDPKYFADGHLRWTEVGLPSCQTLAHSVGATTSFRRLAAGQLLKHLLGLARTSQRSPRLRYVWFDTQCREANEHRKEVERFRECIDSSVDFAAVTYQEVLASLRRVPEPIQGYHAYLQARYLLTKGGLPSMK